jgi:hypothetical protein
MKTIQGKGGANPQGDLWLGLVPNDATSAMDPRGHKIVAPRGAPEVQEAWLRGFVFAIRYYGQDTGPIDPCFSEV